MPPVEEGFRTEGLDLVDGGVDGSAQFDSAKVNGGVVMLDFVDAFEQEDGEVGGLGCVYDGRVVIVFFADDQGSYLVDSTNQFLVFETLVVAVDSRADKFGGLVDVVQNGRQVAVVHPSVVQFDGSNLLECSPDSAEIVNSVEQRAAGHKRVAASMHYRP